MSTGKFFYVEWVRSRAGHWLQWRLKWINIKLMPLSFKMKIRISLHLSLRNAEVVRHKLYTMLKFLNLIPAGSVSWALCVWWIELFLHDTWMSNCWCFELAIINYTIQICFHFGNQNFHCRLSDGPVSLTGLLLCIYWNMRKVFISVEVHVDY